MLTIQMRLLLYIHMLRSKRKIVKSANCRTMCQVNGSYCTKSEISKSLHGVLKNPNRIWKTHKSRKRVLTRQTEKVKISGLWQKCKSIPTAGGIRRGPPFHNVLITVFSLKISGSQFKNLWLLRCFCLILQLKISNIFSNSPLEKSDSIKQKNFRFLHLQQFPFVTYMHRNMTDKLVRNYVTT